MKSLLVLGSLLLLSVLVRTVALPCECNTDRGPIVVTDEPPVIQSQPNKTPAGPRTEITSNVSRNSSQINSTSDTKAIQKVKTKELKNGNTVTVIVDKLKTKNKTNALTDSFDQTNRTIVQDGIEDHTSLTKEKQQQLKEVNIAKNITKHRIVTDKNGNIVSDTVKSKTVEKDRKSEKTKESEVLIRTVKQVTTTTKPELCTTTTEPPPSPRGCKTTTTTTEAPPPCTTTTTTTEAPQPCSTTTTTTTTEAPPPCPTTTTTTTTEAPKPPRCGCRKE